MQGIRFKKINLTIDMRNSKGYNNLQSNLSGTKDLKPFSILAAKREYSLNMLTGWKEFWTDLMPPATSKI